MTSTLAQKAERFAALHTNGCFAMPNAWDAGSARILEAAGFSALGTTSAGYAWAAGQKDGAPSREAVLENARAIAAAVDIPVSADLFNGFGTDPDAVAQTIRLAGAAGLAGGSIEDTTGDRAAPLYDRALAKERIIAAVEAARGLGRPFVLCARADGLLAGACDLDEILARLSLYEEAGADLLYAPALMTLADVERVVRHVGLPVNVLAGIGNEGTIADLAARGVRRVSVGSRLYSAVAGRLQAAADELFALGTFGWTDGAMPSRTLHQLMR
ncbi:MAG: isocitrate lyase/phosphoenolpyruvate mutase family protein [Pseudomonadota bacterium]